MSSCWTSRLDAPQLLLQVDPGAEPVSARIPIEIAFPSVGWHDIFESLDLVGCTQPQSNVVAGLYPGVAMDLCQGGSETYVFPVSVGILQGCPMSGSFFAAWLDAPLLLRAMQTALGWGGIGMVRARADNLGAVARRKEGLLRPAPTLPSRGLLQAFGFGLARANESSYMLCSLPPSLCAVAVGSLTPSPSEAGSDDN